MRQEKREEKKAEKKEEKRHEMEVSVDEIRDLYDEVCNANLVK